MASEDNDRPTSAETDTEVADAPEVWVKPQITSFKPVAAAEGISYRPNDGISNLS
jgi:hypothetical protein